MNKKIIKYLILILFSLLIAVILSEPQICRNAAIRGILLCGRVIIPSLFVFTVCILFIMKILTAEKNESLSRKERFFIILFSMIGGYPVGAKLINNAVTDNKLTPKEGGKMLNYCINAGPAFIIGAVGAGIIGSKKLGYILFISHIISSIIMGLFLKDTKKRNIKKLNKNIADLILTDCFVSSVSEAAAMIIGICGYVILFSVIGAYFEFFAKTAPFLKYFGLFLEVTNGVSQTENIYLISFLLGFSGLCIWFQILSTGKNIKINPIRFILFRIIHGILSVFITLILIKIFKITVPCFSNSVNFSSDCFYKTPMLSAALLSLGIILIISIFSKKNTGNLLDDVV